MNERPEVVAEVRRWVEKAEHDLAAAEHMMALAERGLTDIVCFHCQQCAEKYLKGLLVLHTVDFPKTHDLRVLLELARENTKLDLPATAVVPLNRYTIEGRYPGGWDPIPPKEASDAINMARGVREAARNLFPDTTLEGMG